MASRSNNKQRGGGRKQGTGRDRATNSPDVPDLDAQIQQAEVRKADIRTKLASAKKVLRDAEDYRTRVLLSSGQFLKKVKLPLPLMSGTGSEGREPRSAVRRGPKLSVDMADLDGEEIDAEDVDMEISEDEQKDTEDKAELGVTTVSQTAENQGTVEVPPRRIWPIPPGQIVRPRKPSWWDNTPRETPQEVAGWISSGKLCTGCHDGGSLNNHVPSVRCANCSDVYCVDQEFRNTRCVSVPARAKNWLCLPCIRKINQNPLYYSREMQSIRNSRMNRSYKMRAPELPGFPDAVLNPLIIIQISCLANDHSPQPVASRLWEHVKDVYGTPAVQPVTFVDIRVTRSFRENDPERQAAKTEATTFLQRHPTASVVIVLDAHSYSDDGTVVAYKQESAPLSILLTLALGLRLCTAISTASGPFKILVPVVCGWIWKAESSIDLAKDVMRQWQYRQTNAWTDIPPICNHVIGYSSTALIPWTVSCTLTNVLEDVLLSETSVERAMLLRVGMNHGLMRGTGVVLGGVSDAGEPEYHLWMRSYPDTNLFGLRFPNHCKQCRARTRCIRKRSAKSDPRGERRIVCQECHWGTQWFAPHPDTLVIMDRNLFRWRLPLSEPDWQWFAPKLPGDNTEYPSTTLPNR